ncbi:hypothetical protein [Bifidobacterium pullorum]|uniref:hypothetical protein n=1 Tax=Bifidobacterium pullorum TaxID=78448 RepID=UPI00242C7C66|nr:hypothetical protein [Bifidobacterium pullorum]
MSPDMPKLFPVPNTLHAFDIYRMPVRFEEDKTRSRNHYVICVVVYEDGNSGVAIKLTSNPKWNGIGDIRIQDWHSAGLTHETTARCRQLVRFERSDLQGYIGTLSQTDAQHVAKIILTIPATQQIWL